MFRSVFFISLFLLLGSLQGYAQAVQLLLYRTDSAQASAPLALPSKYNNDQELVLQLKKIVPTLQEQGYLSASIDSIAIANGTYRIFYSALRDVPKGIPKHR